MAALALLHHYIEYLSSPGVLLGCMVVVVPILLSVAAERATGPSKPDGVPGCRRLGFNERSNLQNQHDPLPPSDDGLARVQALFTYPIKSCQGVELAASEVEATGLRYDRLFTFAQLVSKQDKADSKDAGGVAEPSGEWKHQWRFITQRDFPRLALLQTELWLPNPRGRRPLAHTPRANGGSRKNGHVTSAKAAQDPVAPAAGTTVHKQSLRSERPVEQQRPRSRTRGNTLLGQLERGEDGGRANVAPEVDDWAVNGGCLVVRFPFQPDFNPFGLRTETITLRLPLTPTSQRTEAKRYEAEELSIWKDCTLAINVTNEIDADALAKLKYFLGVSNPLALFKVDDTNKRAVTRCLPKDRPGEGYQVGFPDAFPANLLGLASVRATDEQLPKETNVKGRLDARRFRANIYISGTSAFEEDSWKRITLGRRIGRDKDGLFEVEAEYHVACRTARCKLPNVDPDTGLKDRNEPYATLGKTRKVDQGAYPHPCLGMQTIPLFERGMIRVGDEVEVLERGEHEYEKMFG